MKVSELIEKLKEAPPDSEVGFCWFGNHVIHSVQVGRQDGQDRGFVLLYTKGGTRSG